MSIARSTDYLTVMKFIDIYQIFSAAKRLVACAKVYFATV